MSDQPDPMARTFIVCGVVLQKDGKYLLVQEKKSRVYGKWNLPSGRAHQGETLEQAAVREAQEESGFDIKLGKHLLTLHTSMEQPVLHAFAAEINGGELRFPPAEILDARWFAHQEIADMQDQLRNPDYILGAIAAL